MIANILSIAGSDPSGGAGIQADLKAFSACGTYGMAAMTALTAQSTQGVSAIHAVPAEFVSEQIRMILADIRVDAVKIGMIADADIARTVADRLSTLNTVPIVLDPVMVAKGGARLLPDDAIEALRAHLLPLCRLLTPNLPEAAALTGQPEARDRAGMVEQALALSGPGRAVLIKGGHLEGESSPDLLVDDGQVTWFEGGRIATQNTHGTGCSLSSAIAAELGKGTELAIAVCRAKTWLSGAIARSDRLSVGSGHGPVHHFHDLWNNGN